MKLCTSFYPAQKKTEFDQAKSFHSIHERKLTIEDEQTEITENGEKKKMEDFDRLYNSTS